MIPLILQVLKDFRVIGTVIVMILVIKFAKFITTYKKKPRKNIKGKQHLTCKERYGVESYAKSPMYLKKAYNTKKKNKSFNTSNGAAPDSSDWLIYENAGGIAFVPKSAPTDAKTRSHYTSTTTDTADAGKSTCGVYYKAVSGNDNNASAITPVVKVFVKGC